MSNQEILIRAYETETKLYRLRQRSTELAETVKQARYALRSAQQAEVEYSGLRVFLDKISGKYAGKAEDLSRDVRRAEAELSKCVQEQKQAAAAMAELRQQREELPSAEELKQTALQSPETARQWAVSESRFCAEQLLPLMEKNEEALLKYRQLLRGEIPMLSPEEQQEICAEPDLWAQQCVVLLQRLQEALEVLEIPFEICAYYRNPIFFLMYAAAKHNRLDRASQAQDQILQTRKKLREILEQFTD